MNLVYKVNEPLQAQVVADLFRRSGIRRPVDDIGRIQTMIDKANLTISAWNGAYLVGVARALTDEVYCCYLSDLAVDREYQRRGIGKEMIEILQNRVGNQVTILLRASEEAMDYYPKVGFEKAENVYVIARKE